MARKESDREDLLREATALVERIELAPVAASAGDHVVAGFRADGGLSIYFGPDPVYHFNSRGELRRAYYNSLLVKAEAGQLVSLDRRRQSGEVELIRHPLTDDEQAEFVAELIGRLDTFARQCNSNAFVTVGRVPADADVLGRVRDWLSRHRGVVIANSPHAR